MSATATREMLAARVHPEMEAPIAACHVCGQSAPVTPATAKIVPDMVRGSGELIYATCAQCQTDTGTDWQRTAVVEVLDLDPKDRAIDGITVARYSDQAAATPIQRTTTRWGHLNRNTLADEVRRNRGDIERRACPSKEGCAFCGVNITPAGTYWVKESDYHLCGTCHDRRRDWPDVPLRDQAAAVLVGFGDRNQMRIPHNFAANLAILTAEEAGVKKGSDRPFAHLDIAAIRERNLAMIRLGAWSRPGGWQPDRLPAVVQW